MWNTYVLKSVHTKYPRGAVLGGDLQGTQWRLTRYPVVLYEVPGGAVLRGTQYNWLTPRSVLGEFWAPLDQITLLHPIPTQNIK